MIADILHAGEFNISLKLFFRQMGVGIIDTANEPKEASRVKI